jgi:hypothetical protein
VRSCMHACLHDLCRRRRKQALLHYLHSARQQLLRMVALVQWVPKSKALTECVDHGKVLDKAAQHARMLQAAVDDMFAAHVERAGTFNPMFDVQTALEVLTTGAARRNAQHACMLERPCGITGICMWT